MQVPWQEDPLDHVQAQGWGSEFSEGGNQDSPHGSILLIPTGHQILCKGNGCQKEDDITQLTDIFLLL